jgi:hypothetical protein
VDPGVGTGYSPPLHDNHQRREMLRRIVPTVSVIVAAVPLSLHAQAGVAGDRLMMHWDRGGSGVGRGKRK